MGGCLQAQALDIKRSCIIKQLAQLRQKECSFCGQQITLYIYKQSQSNFYLCQDCYQIIHILKATNYLFYDLSSNNIPYFKTHTNIHCNSCKKVIYGIRFKCEVCQNIDFCQFCLQKVISKQHSQHRQLIMSKSLLPSYKLQQYEESDQQQIYYGMAKLLTHKVNKSTIFIKISTQDEFIQFLAMRQLRCSSLFGFKSIVNLNQYWAIVENVKAYPLQKHVSQNQDFYTVQHRIQALLSIARALNKLHKQGIIYQKLSLSAVIVVGQNAYLKELYLVANQQVNQIWRSSNKTGKNADIFSFGLIANYLFSGYTHQQQFPQAHYFIQLINICLQSPNFAISKAFNYLKIVKNRFKILLERQNLVQAYFDSSKKQKDQLFHHLYQNICNRTLMYLAEQNKYHFTWCRGLQWGYLLKQLDHFILKVYQPFRLGGLLLGLTDKPISVQIQVSLDYKKIYFRQYNADEIKGIDYLELQFIQSIEMDKGNQYYITLKYAHYQDLSQARPQIKSQYVKNIDIKFTYFQLKSIQQQKKSPVVGLIID